MFDKTEEILAKLAAGEDSLSEFKELRIEQGTVTAPNAESFAGEMVEQAVMTATLEDLDRAALQRHFTAIPQLDLLRNTKVVIRDESGVDRPTVASLLAFGHDIRDHMPSAFVEAAVYRGMRLDSEYLTYSESIEGSAPQQIDRAVAFVDQLMLHPARKPSGRIDYPQYSLGVVREAIVNAVAHRDYSLSGAKIRLYLFDDRLELYSPGSLPNTLTLESMPFRVFTRNQLLVSFLAKMRNPTTGLAYLESRCEGVRRILEEGESFSGRRPEYRLLDGQELLLTLWGARPPARRPKRGA